MIEVKSNEIPPSKSLYNRALILQSFAPNLMVSAENEFESEDVLHLKKSLEDLAAGKTAFYCGSGAGPLRFLAIRLSRIEGNFIITGTERLFSRPQTDLVATLEQLNCRNINVAKDRLSFQSQGRWPEKITLNLENTSQVLSGILLSSWDLSSSSQVEYNPQAAVSLSYAQMTVNIVGQSGWSGEITEGGGLKQILLPKKQQIVLDEIFIEPDMSCVAALSLLGATSDGIRFWSIPLESSQGDEVIFKILKEMGLRVIQSPTEHPPGFQNVRVEKPKSYKGIEIDLSSTPDLFPGLAAFCSRASTKSILKSLAALNTKESRRLDKMLTLLKKLGVSCEVFGNDFIINPSEKLSSEKLDFDPDEDHRLAMAAAVLNNMGANLTIKNPDVVKKSFPNFWDYVQ